MCQGELQTATVHIIDRFKAIVEVQLPNGDMRTFCAKDVSFHTSAEEKKKRPRRQIARHQEPPPVESTPCSQTDRPATPHVPDVSIITPYSLAPNGFIARCGTTYDLKNVEGNVAVQVRSIVLSEENIIKGCMVIGGDSKEEIKLEAPISALQGKNVTCVDNNRLYNLACEQVKHGLKNATPGERFTFRRNQILSLAYKEMQQALRGKPSQRQCILGLMSPDHDLDVFPLSLKQGQRVHYGRDTKRFNSLALFDSLMPYQWDAMPSGDECFFKYLTKLTFSLSTDYFLKMSVATATCHQRLIRMRYREQIREDLDYMKQAIEAPDSDTEDVN